MFSCVLFKCRISCQLNFWPDNELLQSLDRQWFQLFRVSILPFNKFKTSLKYGFCISVFYTILNIFGQRFRIGSPHLDCTVCPTYYTMLICLPEVSVYFRAILHMCSELVDCAQLYFDSGNIGLNI